MKPLPILIAVGVIGLVCVAQILRLGFFERLEWMTYDWRVREAANFSPTVATNLGFVYIDDESIDAVGSGELDYQFGLYWPRYIYGLLVRELAAQGAKAVAFDVIFGGLRTDHPSFPVSDKSLLAIDKLFGRTLDRFEDETLLPSDDFFAWQMKKAGNVIVADTKSVAPHDLFRTNALAVGVIDADKDTDGVLRRAKAFKEQRRWHPLFVQTARKIDVDLRNARVEADRIVLPRDNGEELEVPIDQEGNFELKGAKKNGDVAPRAKAFITERVWHMGIVLAAEELKLDLSKAEVDLEHGRIALRGPVGVERIVPVDRNGYFYIDWMLRREDQRLAKQNVKDLLKQDRDRHDGEQPNTSSRWQNKLVVVGSTATGNDLSDLGATPLDKETNLMGKHWNIANSVIMNRFIQRSSLPMELFLIVVLGAAVAFLTWGLRSFTAFLGVLALATGYVALGFYCYVQYRYWMPLVLPVAGAMLMQYICLVTHRAIFEQDEKRRVKSVFSRIVSPDVVNELLGAENLKLGGARRDVTVLFADVRGFTELTDLAQERVTEFVRARGLTGNDAETFYDESARETLETVNLYLACVADMVKQHNGTLDKYIGDCVMAFWGAPATNAQHALACVRAAIDAQRAIHALNQKRVVENQQREQDNPARLSAGSPPKPPVATLTLGTGINTGSVTVGLMGSDAHILNYTVFGREVNLASRLESVSGRGRIVISEATYNHLQRDDPTLAAKCIPLEAVNVKGIRSAVKIYEVPWLLPGETNAATVVVAAAPVQS
jgi:class 3 adenylate cyclase/CHASE2 domain-containing sensor protein